ncbi:MAG: CRP-like cAMP-binding protein, partial [Phenylobacterium sp.]
DSEILLPSDEVYNFEEYRARINAQSKKEGLPKVVVGSAGMLAIAEPWRKRRDVFRALFKMACDIGHTWDTTHIVATVNVKTASIYHRLNFEVLSEELWIPSIGESVLPVANAFEAVYQWAFGAFASQSELIQSFAGCFECLLVSAGSLIFREGETGHEVYLVGKGLVKITQADTTEKEVFNLATLGKGDMFGELSLIDDQPRSGSAWAMTNVELIVLSREVFWRKIHEEPDYLKSLLTIMSQRIRDIDERAFIYAHGSVDVRLKYFINKVLNDAVQSNKDANVWVAKITLEELARTASAPLVETENYLLRLEIKKRLKLGSKDISFYGNQEI